jgi:DNA repair photolyase
MKTYKAAPTVRGDCLRCPLCLQIDSYWGCTPNCYHCSFRRLNRTWGKKLRKADPEAIRKKLVNGLKNGNPRSSLAWALYHKKTIRIGSKSDPYQPAETKYRVTRRILEILIELKWSFVIWTHFTHNLAQDEGLLSRAHELGLLTLTPVVSPGGEADWEVLERKKTTPIPERLKLIRRWVRKGWNVGVNGEDFIPGYHTPKQFRDMVRRLKSIGVRSYNTYNLHGKDLVYKNLHAIGLDIMKIWTMNQDDQWRPIQRKLCAIAQDEGIILGCPDWVNTAPDWQERTNTCCGVNVPRPSKFNTHYFKRLWQKGYKPHDIITKTWEGIGDKDEAQIILNLHPSKDYKGYTMADTGMIASS